MLPDQIVSVIEMYEARLQQAGVPKQRMDTNRTFGSLRPAEALAHAHFLCDGVKRYAKDPSRQRKVGSHLTAVQMCLSLADWYTLEQLMAHNRPTAVASEKPVQGNGFLEPSWAT